MKSKRAVISKARSKTHARIHLVFSVFAASVPMARGSPAWAVHGDTLIANGAMTAGMGGTSLALPLDSTAGADNPAGMAYVPNQTDIVGVGIFTQFRASAGPNGDHFGSAENVPAGGGGVNYHLSPRWTIGASLSGTGLAANYHAPLIAGVGLAEANSSLTQINLAPTVSYLITPNLSIGGSIIGGIQRFRANGLVAALPNGSFAAVPGHGYSYSDGYGGSVGIFWRPFTWLSLGASWFSQMYFSKPGGYENDLLAATGGSINSAAHSGIGIAVKLTPSLTVGLDYTRVYWAETQPFNATVFGWHDQNVIQFGGQYQITPKFTVRAGAMLANSQLDGDHTAVNFYTPVVVDKAVTGGFTYKVSAKNDLSFAAEYDIPRAVNGSAESAGTDIHNDIEVVTFGLTHRF